MDPKLEQAVQAIKSGDKSAGLVLLAQVIRADPNNESAWIWMATAQDDPIKKKQCLEQVLRINPANDRVRVAISTLFPAPVQPPVMPPAVETAPQPPIEEPPVAVEPPAVMEPPAIPPEPVEAVMPEQPEAVAPAAPVEAAQVPSQAVEAAQHETPPAVTEPPPVEAAGPDLSWLKETTFAPEEPKEEAADLSWLKEDLPAEEPGEGQGPEHAGEAVEPEQPQVEPASDLSWLKESQPGEEQGSGFTWPPEPGSEIDISGLAWMKEEPGAPGEGASETAIPPSPTGETDDSTWMRAATAGMVGGLVSGEKPASEEKPPSEEPDFSWLTTEPDAEEAPGVEPSREGAAPWLEETPPAEGEAAKNEVESIPDWLHQGTEAEAGTTAHTQLEADLSAPEPPAPESPTLESERLRPEDIEAITSKPAELPFTWDEITGEPVLKPGVETAGETLAAQPGEEVAQAPGEASTVVPEPPASQQQVAASATSAVSAPISRPRSAAAAAAPAKVAGAAASTQKKGLTRGQIVLLSLLGVATLIVIVVFGLYLAVNFGLLK